MNDQNQTSAEKLNVQEMISALIINLLEKGIIPWRQLFEGTNFPCNLITNRSYRGINVWLLASLGFKQNYFLTFKQLSKAGYNVKKGEKSWPVMYLDWLDMPEGGKAQAIMNYYRVFNIEQLENLPEHLIPVPKKRITKAAALKICARIVEEMPLRPEIRNVENMAYYLPLFDYINMPELSSIKNEEVYFEILFRQMIHSTGHKLRLNRKEMVHQEAMGGEKFSIEELIASIGASYLAAYCGIKLIDLTANTEYINGWISKLKTDKRLIIYACGLAQKAVDYILNIPPPEKDQIEDEPTQE
ncbi:MAG: zincin-like metallopeptidase domain-containing protein [Bacteroidota bacterium]|nr:zincin-like metallopeptidase domain-containing protein [Bacteroidota bacterium]